MPRVTSEPDEALAELYGAAPEEFVLVRARLERELKAQGAADAAAQIKRRRRPHLAAWACNQLARGDPDAIAALFEATVDLAAAQQGLIGGGPAEELRAAARARQALIDELADRGVRMLSGRAPKPAQYRDNIVSTLDAATLDEVGARDLRAGRLTQPMLAPAGFGPLDGAVPAGSARTARKPSSRELDKARRDVEHAREQVRAAAAAADDADAEVASADLAAQSALAHLQEVDRAQERARAAVADTNEQLSEAQRSSQRARGALREAMATVQEAEARLAGLGRA